MNYAKSIKINNEDILIQFVYISDQDRYMVLYRHFYEGLDGMIFVYNVYLRYTFDLIKDQIKEFSENIDLSTIKIMIVSHQMKKGKEEEKECVSKEEGEELVRKLGCKFYEVNANSGMNINESICVDKQYYNAKK